MINLNRECRLARSVFLAAGHRALLHPASRGRDLLEPTHAIGGWNLPVGKTRIQRVRWLYRGVEPLVAFHHCDRAGWNVRDHQHLLRHRSECGLDA